MNLMRRFFGHLSTVTHHKRLVRKYCFRIGLYRQGLAHDLSKFSPAEFLPGVKYYLGTRSPQTMERDLHGVSAAWMHHKGRNRHHFEYWHDYLPGGAKPETCVEMPARWFAEMICDRIAASQTYLKDKYRQSAPYDYFAAAKHSYAMHPATLAKLEAALILLRDEGEERLFSYLRREVLKKR
ncbi:MAG: DUF5662 family protein [Oscillospiraceae bacterium]